MNASPRLVFLRCLTVAVLTAMPQVAAAQAGAPEAQGAVAVVKAPSLAQRIDPIVPPVLRVASAKAVSGPVVASAKRAKMTLSMLKRQAAAALKSVAAPKPAATAATPSIKTGVQAVGSAPDAVVKKSPRAAPLAPEKRSALGRVTTTAQGTKPAKAAVARLAKVTKTAITRATPKR